MSRASYIKDGGEGRRFDVMHTAKCLGMAYILSVILLFLLSVAATIWDLESGVFNICITFITAVCIVFCGFKTARGAGKGGLVNGIIAGVIYTLLLYAAGSIAIGSFAFNLATVTAFVIGIVCGGAGGVMGVNTKKRGR